MAAKSMDKVVKGSSYQVLERVVSRTPVGHPELWKRFTPAEGYEPGRLRGGWGVNGTESTDRIDYTGDSAIDAGYRAIKRSKRGNDITIRNPVPYAEEIEFGYSKLTPPNQAIMTPQGMVALTSQEFPMLVTKEVSKLK